MKKTHIVIALILLGTATGAFAQTQFAVGIKGGPNFANIDTDAGASANYKNRTGWNAGAFVLIRGERIGFQPELLFSQQGSKFTLPGNSQEFENEFSYINVPLIFKLYTIAGINLQVGPQIGFLTNARNNYTVGNGGDDIKGDLKNTDWSLALGVGWDLPLGLSIDGRYNWGFTDVNKDWQSAGSGTDVWKNQVWQLSVGYKLFRSGDIK